MFGIQIFTNLKSYAFVACSLLSFKQEIQVAFADAAAEPTAPAAPPAARAPLPAAPAPVPVTPSLAVPAAPAPEPVCPSPVASTAGTKRSLAERMQLAKRAKREFEAYAIRTCMHLSFGTESFLRILFMRYRIWEIITI